MRATGNAESRLKDGRRRRNHTLCMRSELEANGIGGRGGVSATPRVGDAGRGGGERSRRNSLNSPRHHRGSMWTCCGPREGTSHTLEEGSAGLPSRDFATTRAGYGAPRCGTERTPRVVRWGTRRFHGEEIAGGLGYRDTRRGALSA